MLQTINSSAIEKPRMTMRMIRVGLSMDFLYPIPSTKGGLNLSSESLGCVQICHESVWYYKVKTVEWSRSCFEASNFSTMRRIGRRACSLKLDQAARMLSITVEF